MRAARAVRRQWVNPNGYLFIAAVPFMLAWSLTVIAADEIIYRATIIAKGLMCLLLES
jgi:hypothetical protein